TAVIGDSLTRKEHDSDRELQGQGIANMVAGLFGALPGAGATMVTTISLVKVGTTILGKPAGISPIRRISSVSKKITENRVTT
uniref:SulP family inorganic anion transporter n=1 Tax=Vibrio cholerae TaxID=666 RepID=UPI00307FEB1E